MTIAADSSSTGAATFTASSASYTAASVTSPRSPAPPAPQVHVSGNELADASGNQVILHSTR